MATDRFTLNRAADTMNVPVAARTPTRFELPRNSLWMRELGPWLMMGIAVAPMWLIHGRNLWFQPQYQVFPLLYLVLAGLMYREVRFDVETSHRRRWVSRVALLASGLVFSASVLLYSPSIAQLAGILWLLGGLIRYAGNVTLPRIGAYGSLLLLTVIPQGLSLRLAQGLQRITSEASSGALETLGVPHIRSGNVIEVAGRSLFVDEACSGIQSLFAALCVVVIIAVVQRSPLLISVLSLASVPLWALMGNMVRIVAISAAHTWWQWDLAQGLPHAMLGYGNFLLIAAYLYMWVKLLGALLEPIPLADEMPPPSIEAFNRLVQWPGGRANLTEPFLESERGKQAASFEPQANELEWAPAPSGLAARMAWTWSGGLLLLGFLNVAFMLAYGEQAFGFSPQAAFDFSIRDSLPGKDAFVAVENTWPIVDFEVVERQTGSIFGNFSHAWRVSPPRDFSCVASLDFPFFGYHDVSICYRHSGWDITRVREFALKDHGNAAADDEQPGHGSQQLVAFDMERSNGSGYGYVVFGLFDQHGHVTSPPQPLGLWAQVTRHLRRGPLPLFVAGEREKREHERPLLQFQVVCEKSSSFTDEDRELVKQQFASALDAVRLRSTIAFNAAQASQP